MVIRQFTMAQSNIEPLLQKDPSRASYFPVKHHDLDAFGERGEQAIWVTQEVDLKRDRADWATLNDNVRQFVSFIIAFFAEAEDVVIDNLVHWMHTSVEVPEAKFFFGIQIGVETIHWKQYNKIIDSLIDDENEKNKLFEAAKSVPVIKAKADWARRCIQDANASFAMRTLMFAVVEMIFFSASFAGIYWVRVHLGKLPGLCQANELIARDEGLHCEFACHILNNHIQEKLPTETIHRVVREAAEIEKAFVRESLRTDLIGMRADQMCAYVEYISDRLLADLKQPPIFHTKNPFVRLMRFISAPCKKNFFEGRVTEYKRGEAKQQTVVNDENW